MRSWYWLTVNGDRFQAYTDADRAQRHGGEPCAAPADLAERFLTAAGGKEGVRSRMRDGLLEQGYGPLDHLPVSWRHAREARERGAR